MGSAKHCRSMLTLESLKQTLSYDSRTGVFIWLKTLSSKGPAGQRAGYLHADGGIYIGIGNHRYSAHRLAWFYMHGEWPPDEVDHVNMVRDDNRIENLRLATKSENMRNRRATKRSASGVKGVSWSRHAKRWRASICVDKKQKNLGYYDNVESAQAAYIKAASALHGEFARAA